MTSLCSLRTRYHEQVRRLGQTGGGLMIDDLQRADKTKGLLGQYLFFSHISDSRLAGQINQDFPWFSVLHGWWRSNPTYNVAYSTADAHQDFAAQAATLFKMQPEFPMDTDPSPPVFLPAHTVHDTPTASTSNLPGPEDMIGGDDLLPPPPVGVDDGAWSFNDVFSFDDLDMDFNFTDPSTSLVALLPATPSTAPVPAASSTAAIPAVSPTALLPAMSSATLPPTTTSTAPIPATSPTIPVPATSPTIPVLATPSVIPAPAESFATPVAPAKPTVISLNDDAGYHPPYRPPLVPSHAESQRIAARGAKFCELRGSSVPTTDDSDSDAIATNLFTSLNLMKHKTPMPEVSSEETDPKGFFSLDPSPSTTTSKSSHKCARLLASERFNTNNVSTSIITTVCPLQEQKSLEHHADRDQKKVVREEQLMDKKAQHEHELAMLQHCHEHKMAMASHQKNLADSEIRKMELELEIMKYQGRVMGQSEAEPEYGEGTL